MSVIITLRQSFVLLLEDTQFAHKEHFMMEDNPITSL